MNADTTTNNDTQAVTMALRVLARSMGVADVANIDMTDMIATVTQQMREHRTASPVDIDGTTAVELNRLIANIGLGNTHVRAITGNLDYFDLTDATRNTARQLRHHRGLAAAALFLATQGLAPRELSVEATVDFTDDAFDALPLVTFQNATGAQLVAFYDALRAVNVITADFYTMVIERSL